MNIVFMGTPDFAIPSLKILIENRSKVVAVVTAPDKERGRGQKVSFTPVKEFALKHNLPVLQPEKLDLNAERPLRKITEHGVALFQAHFLLGKRGAIPHLLLDPHDSG